MSLLTKRAGYFMVTLIMLYQASVSASPSADSVILYTPYTRISVTPGQSIDYSIELINNSKEVITPDLALTGMPKGWNHSLKANNFNISQLSVLPGERKSCSLFIETPLKVNKGTYRFTLTAGKYASLPILVVVTEEGTFKTEFTSKQSNMQGPATSAFSYQTTLRNSTASRQNYALMADAPQGWTVSFTESFKKVTAVTIEPNSTSEITVEIDPPDMVEAKAYKVPVRAITGETSAGLELEAVITGTYSIELTTPTGLLSESITAGDQRRIDMLVRNTGSAELINVTFENAKPIGWEVAFEPKAIEKIPAGSIVNVVAIIKASKKAIAGDYVTDIIAKTPEVSSKASFRISVKTPLVWGWVGIVIILAAAGSVYYLFRKYGRR